MTLGLRALAVAAQQELEWHINRCHRPTAVRTES